MKVFTYKMTRDFGFAPNPFWGYCTLANCKPSIRRIANVGDWIIGTGGKSLGLEGYLIYVMNITGKISYEDYWNDKEFSSKRPILNGSLAQMHGDNIYFRDKNAEWHQVDSHHSLVQGKLNQKNLITDLGGKYVLTSKEYIYLGDNCQQIPEEYQKVCSTVRDFMVVKDLDLARNFIYWLYSKYSVGIHGDPIDWNIYDQLSLW